ncbi:MAG: ABC transporter ATP-binding protein [Clostridiales bacterium]|nr:ABC transporter ATP-binding protein [Clostridiales bacterium]
MERIPAPLLQVQEVYKEFPLPGKQVLHAVNGVNLNINAGECLAVVGESGCGKSTLARMIARVEPLTKGKVCFQGKAIETLQGEALRQLRKQMQMIFQNPAGAFSPRMKIGAFLREPFVNHKILSRKDASDKARQLLLSVGLPEEYANRYPHQLSGGELQRVAIVRAMALQPLLLICDEPTSALDVSIQQRIIALLDHMRQEYEVSLLFISHDLALVNHFSERIVVMYLGFIVESMPSVQLGREAKHPYTRALLQAVFQQGKDRREKIHVLDGEPPNPIDLSPGCPFQQRCPHPQKQCKEVMPLLREIAPGHLTACHLVPGH